MNKYIDTIFDLSGKNAVVFGGLGQIGLFSVEILINAGAKVTVYDIQELGNQFSSGPFIKAQKAGLLKYKIIDVTSDDEVRMAAENLIHSEKKIDILINHVHYKGDPKKLKPHSPFFADLSEYPFDVWKETIDTNLNGMFLITKHFGSKMIDSGGGVILNTSSTYGIVSPRFQIYGDSGINSPISYATSKAAIINFTKYVSTHWAKFNIRANCLSPGGVKNVGQSESFRQAYSNNTPLSRMAEANEYQGAVLFLVSEASSYVTGENLVADGGWTAW